MSDDIGDATGEKEAKDLEHVCSTCTHLGRRSALMAHRSSLPCASCARSYHLQLGRVPPHPLQALVLRCCRRGAAEGCSEAPRVNKGKRARGGVAARCTAALRGNTNGEPELLRGARAVLRHQPALSGDKRLRREEAVLTKGLGAEGMPQPTAKPSRRQTTALLHRVVLAAA